MAGGTAHRTSLAALVALGLGSSACARGFVFSYTVVPLDVNFDRTPVLEKSASDNTKKVQYRGLRIEWGDEAIGEIAREHGLQTVHYADLEVLNVLGIWTQRWVRIYGE